MHHFTETDIKVFF